MALNRILMIGLAVVLPTQAWGGSLLTLPETGASPSVTTLRSGTQPAASASFVERGKPASDDHGQDSASAEASTTGRPAREPFSPMVIRGGLVAQARGQAQPAAPSGGDAAPQAAEPASPPASRPADQRPM